MEETPFYSLGYKSIGPIFPRLEKSTRVVAFTTDKGEYREELMKLTSDARELAYRHDLRVAKVTDPELVREYKEEQGLKWFSEFSTSSVVHFRKYEKDLLGNVD